VRWVTQAIQLQQLAIVEKVGAGRISKTIAQFRTLSSVVGWSHEMHCIAEASRPKIAEIDTCNSAVR
jgi:hypothetical protein